MRVINNVVVLICGAVNLAYARPDLSNATDTADPDSTPCPFADFWFDLAPTEESDQDGLDDNASIEEGAQQEATEQSSPAVLKGSSSNETASTMELRRSNEPVKKGRVFRNGYKKKQSSTGTPNIYLPTADPNTSTNQSGSNQNQNGGGVRGQNRNTPNIYLPNADPSTSTSINTNEGKKVRSSRCFTTAMYDAIDADIMRIQRSFTNVRLRGSFLGGLLRMAAHDAMDYDPRRSPPMGPDGCYDPNHPNNAGLDFVRSRIDELYVQKYSYLSKADFWVACANAAVRQTSIGQQLNMKNSFRWGRQDSNSCFSQGARLPSTRGCSQTEDVFLNRMRMTWEEAVALMGAHTLGHGNRVNSGHQGTWAPNNNEAMVFDKKYYEQLFRHNWQMSGQGLSQDWRTGNFGSDQMMLNTDVCLAYNIDSVVPCCTTGNFQCRQCPRYPSGSPRKAAEAAVLKMLGGMPGNTNNGPFYESFERAWNKMTSAGQNTLMPLTTQDCLI